MLTAVRARTDSVAATRALAGTLADLVRPGDLLMLTGDLGAGKTAFTQGLGAALGVAGPITSPTFTLHRRYAGRLTLHHLDVYRLDQLDEVADLGLAELLDDDAVTVIEWGDTIRPALPEDLLEIRISLGPGDDDRELAFLATGAGWQERLSTLVAALEPWLVTGC